MKGERKAIALVVSYCKNVSVEWANLLPFPLLLA